MFGLIVFLWLISIPILAVSLIKPSLVVKLLKKPLTAKQVKIGVTGLTVILTVLLFVTVPNGKNNIKPNNATASPNPTVTQTEKAISSPKPTPASTPTPLDPCKDQAGTRFYLSCLDMQERKNPLKATIKHDNYAIYVTNNESTNWSGCFAILDDFNPDADNYGTNGMGFTVEAGQIVTLPWSEMVNNENLRFNYFQTKPTSVDFQCTVNKESRSTRFSLQ